MRTLAERRTIQHFKLKLEAAMKGERFYVANDSGRLLVIGWNLDHEPTPDNECGYEIEAGPFMFKSEAEEYVNA